MGVVLSLATQTVKNMVCMQLQESESSTYRSSAERRLYELVASNLEKRSLQLLLCVRKKKETVANETACGFCDQQATRAR